MLALEGVKVLDLTHVIAGPLATHQLCVMGAEVIKIERPEFGDSARSLAAQPELEGLTPAFKAINIGKKSVVLDLKTQDGRDAVLKLAKTADVFVENFRPGVAKKLGLAAEDIRGVNSDIIYCSISGWGQSGPMSQTPAYDHVVQAATGLMAMQGDESHGEDPIKIGFPVIDAATGMTAATAIVSALLRRARGDTSPIELDVSMIDSALVLNGMMVAGTRAAGKPLGRAGNRGFVASPGADTLPTKDGYISLGANTFGQFRKLCETIGRPELAAAPYLPEGLPEDGFLTNLATSELRDALIDAMESFEALDLEERLLAKGVPAAKVRNLHEFLTELYPDTPGADIPQSDGVLGTGFRWLGERQAGLRPAPKLGQDTDAYVK